MVRSLTTTFLGILIRSSPRKREALLKSKGFKPTLMTKVDKKTIEKIIGPLGIRTYKKGSEKVISHNSGGIGYFIGKKVILNKPYRTVLEEFKAQKKETSAKVTGWKKVGPDFWKFFIGGKKFRDSVKITKTVEKRWVVRDPFGSHGIETRNFPNRPSAVKYARAYMKKN